jgi:hypothetical protein
MTIAESMEIILGSCIIDFYEIQLWLRSLSLSLNICKITIMMIFLRILSENFIEI